MLNPWLSSNEPRCRAHCSSWPGGLTVFMRTSCLVSSSTFSCAAIPSPQLRPTYVARMIASPVPLHTSHTWYPQRIAYAVRSPSAMPWRHSQCASRGVGFERCIRSLFRVCISPCVRAASQLPRGKFVPAAYTSIHRNDKVHLVHRHRLLKESSYGRKS